MDYCYGCLPGGPFPPPPCIRCGSAGDYYSAGMCGRCHPYAPQHVDSCRDCCAWGVARKHEWLCWGCRYWRRTFPVGTCAACRRQVPVNPGGACRLCWRQAASLRWTKTGLSIAGANRGGTQLFFANMGYASPAARGNWDATGGRLRPATAARARVPPFRPATHRQLVLFEMPRDLKAGQARGFPGPALPAMADALAAAVAGHAAAHGWGPKTAKGARRGIMILLGLQDTPGAPLRSSDIHTLHQLGLPVRPVLDVCDQAGMLEDDRAPVITGWFREQIRGLPGPMATELGVWFRVMTRGSATPPRRRPRAEGTTRIHLRWVLPTLRNWAAGGHQSLREISRADVLAALPPAGNPRSTLGSGLRSVFTILKTEKVIFANPAAGIPTGPHETRYPLPAKVDTIREALNSPNPACALITALAAFHGLRAGELRAIKLTDIHDGRLHLSQRAIPLAEPVRARLAAYLHDRGRRWPRTANPHLLINHATAGSTRPFGGRWLSQLLPMPVRIIREDRILHEIHATGGDVRRVCDLFGLTVAGAMRYAATLDPPGLQQDRTRNQH